MIQAYAPSTLIWQRPGKIDPRGPVRATNRLGVLQYPRGAVTLATSLEFAANAVESGMAFRRSGDTDSRKPTYPTEDTHQEAAYLKALGENQRPVHVKLLDGEVVRGWIEYYDRRMIRLTRDGAPNLFIYKHDIAYIAEEGTSRSSAVTTRATRASGPAPTTPDIPDSDE